MATRSHASLDASDSIMMGSVLPSELSSGLPGDNVVSHQHYAVSLGGINVDAKRRRSSLCDRISCLPSSTFRNTQKGYSYIEDIQDLLSRYSSVSRAVSNMIVADAMLPPCDKRHTANGINMSR
ncbi:hypothetical protein HBI56_045030 [Parastagonospora nodorum]|nr:hypothetical protein HBH56_058150 [Parastagonospora nodorum]KAH3930832.1 hypothetical protein HBH54_102080 [Parastagonospora nodorum]KAH3977159.1 hypothetical protein HBH52_111180 [Parastagonospora nodorum]KAH4121438.1 hypothetical protein HBH47_099040 [Parastagonospora nodorum]KAH4140710.1 hypothetical protein HBH45_079690 [Parastagonospora nodorum]